MTTVVSNSSGRQGGKPVRKNPSSNASHSGDHIKDNEKFQPTAEQMRIASLMTDKRDADSDLKPKIDQIVELTGATRDDAAIALYDCDNDMAKAVEMILDGEALESEWQSTGKKKKQKQPAGSAPAGPAADPSAAGASLNGQKNGDDRKFDKSRRDRNNGFEENGSAGADYKNSENGRPLRGGKRDGTFKPRGDRRGGGFVGGSVGGRDPDQVQDGGASGDDDRGFSQGVDGPRRGGFGGRGGRGGAFAGRGRGAPRGGRGGRGGARTFGTRPQGTDKPSDEFLGSIDTWTNEPKPDESGVNTMKVGNWSDFNGQEWSSENWNESMENKAFNSSEKNGPSTGSNVPDGPKPVVPQPPTQMSFLSAASKSIEKESQQAAQQAQQQSQPASTPSNFSSIASSVPSKRPEPTPQQSVQPQTASTAPQQATSQPSQQQTSQVSQQQTQVTAGRALLNQIQQPQTPSQASQPAQQQTQQQPSPQQPSLKPVQPSQNAAPGLGMNMYNKNATESIKSLVGLSGSAIGEPLSGDISKQMSTNTRINAPAQQARSKPAESAVEMPTNDVHNISLRFGSLDFNSSATGANAQPSFSTIPQESIFEAPTSQKPEKNLNALMEQAAAPTNASTGGYRSNAQGSAQKNVILSDVLSSEKISSSNNYSSAPKKDYMMGGYGKNSSYNSSENYNSSYYQPQQPNFPQNYYNPAQNQFNSGSLMQPGTFNSGSTYGGNTASVPVAQQQQQTVKDSQQSQSNVPVGSAPTSSASNTLGLMSNSTNTTNVLKTALPATGKGVHNNSSNPSMPPGVQGFAQHQTMVPGSYLTTNNGVPVPYMPFPAYQGMADPFRTESFNSYPSADMKFNRGSEADMSAGSSQTVQSMAGQGAHNQYPLNMGPGMANMSPFGYFPNLYGYMNPQQFNTHSYGMPPTTNSLPTNFAGKNNTAYGSNTHSYNSAYDNIGSAGSANVGGASANAPGVTGTQNADYIKSGYGSQQMPHNKSLQSSGSASELSGSNQGNTNGQPMYNKSHSQINKNFEKPNPYQPNNQFMGGNNGLGGGYGSQSSYLLTQPQMNLGGDQTSAGPQTGGSGAGHRGSMKGNPGGQSGQGYGAKLWN